MTLGPIPKPPPPPPNPLTPLLMELTTKLLSVTQGKLFAKCSVTGPRDIAELITLMKAAGMDAAVWLLEPYAYEDNMETREQLDLYRDDFAAIQRILEREGAGKLNDIDAIINPPDQEE